MPTVSCLEEAGGEVQIECVCVSPAAAAAAGEAERDGLRVHYSHSAMCRAGTRSLALTEMMAGHWRCRHYRCSVICIYWQIWFV